MRRRCLVVLGTLASSPYAGMAWMHMQLTEGLRRLGHDVYYFEATSNWPYDPVRGTKVQSADYAVPYLARVASGFGLEERWAYRASYADKAWFGLPRRRAEELLARADAVFDVAGATPLAEEGLTTGRLVLYGTDPLYHEITYRQGDEEIVRIVEEHDAVVTYGENIGSPACPVEPLPNTVARTRQPVLLDLWRTHSPARGAFTTVANWRQEGRQVAFAGEHYSWSKDREFMRFLDLPRRTSQRLQLATNLAPPPAHGKGEAVRAFPVGDDAALLAANGWSLVDANELTTDPLPYRAYVQASRAEFTVARDVHARLKSGWFSERSACYLAAGRPVVTQDTGFGTVLPTGEGLFAVETVDEAVEAIATINANYDAHSGAARAIAEEFFDSRLVLAKLLDNLGL